MALSKQEFDTILNDNTKTIAEDISWEGTRDFSAREFRINIDSDEDTLYLLRVGTILHPQSCLTPSSIEEWAESMALI